MSGLSATRVVQQLLLSSALLLWVGVCPAADALGSVPTAHGPQMMLYIKQPLGARGAARVYGLRLERLVTVPTLPTPGAIATGARREIVDLQIRRYSDVRVEFDRRVTWDIGRQEFGPSSNHAGMTIGLPLRTMLPAMVARAQP